MAETPTEAPAGANGATTPPDEALREPTFQPPPPDVAKAPAAQLDEQEASSLLHYMLSAEPAGLPEESFTLERLGFDVKLRALNEKEIQQIEHRARRPATREEKDQGLAFARDPHRGNVLAVATAMVDPDLRNPELLGKHGPNPEHVVQRWFLPGEITRMGDKIMDLSGYAETAVVRAKES